MRYISKSRHTPRRDSRRQISLLRLLIFSVVFFSVEGACTPAPEFNPCFEIECSHHGRCDLVVGDDGQAPKATCTCDTGYTPSASGWLCLLSQDTSLCAGIDCTGHGHCVSVRGAPRCNCDTGFLPDASGLRCDDICATLTCGLGGVCVHADGAVTCDCPPGTRTSLDGEHCEADGGPYAVYEFTMDNRPDWTMGHATLDFSGAKENKLVEVMSFGFPVDHNRGFSRTTRQIWTLDDAGEMPINATLEDALTQGKVTHRRQTIFSVRRRASEPGYAFDATLQRLDKILTVTGTTQKRSPLPMVGASEYPGWSLGCFSPAFYMFIKRRYDFAAEGVQAIEVFYPSTAIVTTVNVRVDNAASTPSSRVLEFPDEQTIVTYAGDLPKTIHFTRNAWSWRLIPNGAPADANLAPPPPATLAEPTTLPPKIDAPRTLLSPDGVHLAATFTTPPSPKSKLPAILIVGGPFAIDRDHPHRDLPRSPFTGHLAAHLAADGYATLRYDPRGKGQSQGDPETSTLAQLQDDARAAWRALVAEPGVDPARVYVLSANWGSVIALPLLTTTPPPRAYLGLAPVVAKIEDAFVFARTEHLVASGFSKRFVNSQQTTVKDQLLKIAAGTLPDTHYDGLPRALFVELLAYDGRPALSTFPGPILLLRGDQDLESDPAQIDLAVDAATSAKKSDLDIQTLAGLTFHFSAGKRSNLWETSVLPLIVAPALTTTLSTWLASH
ncbi:MAG: alpha/beta hydrolase [Deltaproteobacteria bacterium]|nr:alpha/beta hydrolase [Deltaproteobacteria bacterium]